MMSALQRSSSSTCPDLFGVLLRYLDVFSGLYILSLSGDALIGPLRLGVSLRRTCHSFVDRLSAAFTSSPSLTRS